MAYDAVQIEMRNGTERLITLEKFSSGFTRQFYVQVARTRKLLLIESTPPLRILKKYDTMIADKKIKVERASYVMATHAKNLGSLWDPCKNFLVTFIDTPTYRSMLQPAYLGLIAERSRQEARHNLELSKRFYDDDLTPEMWSDFRDYKQQIAEGNVDPSVDCRLLSNDEKPAAYSDKKIVERGFCVSRAITIAAVEWKESMNDLHRHRASLRCIEGWLARPDIPREKNVFQRNKK